MLEVIEWHGHNYEREIKGQYPYECLVDGVKERTSAELVIITHHKMTSFVLDFFQLVISNSGEVTR